MKNQMDRQNETETFFDNKMDKYWRTNVNIGAQYAKIRQKISDRLDRFQKIRDGPLGRMDLAKQHTELTATAVLPINSAWSRAGREAREVEKSEIDRMHCKKIIERAPPELELPIVFAPKKDGSLQLCIDYRKLNVVNDKDFCLVS